MCLVSILLFSLCLSAYYPFCGAQSVEEEGCPSFVTISELTSLLGNVLRPDDGPRPNIIIREHYINCLSVGSILGYIRQATYTVHFTGEPGNNGSTLAQVDLICVQNVQQGNRFWQLGSFNSYSKITNISDAILLATNNSILSDCSRCNAPNHPNFGFNSSNDDQLRHCQRCPNECLATNLTRCYGASPTQCCNVYFNNSCAVQCPTNYSASLNTNFICEFNPCNENEFYCRGQRKCLSSNLICDGCIDCIDDDSSDFGEERNCPNRKVACTEGEVRLLGGPDNFTGVLTVCVNGALTLVCDRNFDIREANVICRQAGFVNRAGLILDSDTYRADVYRYPFAFGGIICNGNEQNILQCRSYCPVQPPALPGSACCSRDRDDFIVMSCIPSSNKCTDGNIRLVGGSTSSEGIVEMCLGGHYGYICQNEFSVVYNKAILTCGQLGYDPAGTLPFNGIKSTIIFGVSTSPPLVRNPSCPSGSTSLLDCVLYDLSFSQGQTCDSPQINFGVRCDDIQPTGCKEGAVRLVTRSEEGEGLVQICFNNTWYMLCQNTFGSNEAEVVCNQLGYMNDGIATRRTVFSPLVLPKRPVSVMLSFSCVGNETNITDCIDSEPAFVSLCNNSQSEFIQVTCPVPPVVGVFPMSKDGNYTLEYNRDARIQCISTTGGYIIITKTNETGSFTIINTFFGFTSASSGYFINKRSDGGLGVTSEDAGFYTCNVTSTDGFTRIVHINITVLVPEGPYSEVFMRFSAPEAFFPNVSRGGIQITLDYVYEPGLLSFIPVEESGIQTIECVPVTNRPEELSRNYLRMECSIRNYPPINNTLELVQRTLIFNEDTSGAVCPESVTFSDTGFCDYEKTISLIYGNYTWIETFGGNTVSTKCASKQDSNFIRKCLPYGDGWADIDFTACRQTIPPLPNSFSIFIRFSANFTSIVPSGNASSVLDNIRITIVLALSVPVEVICEEVPKQSGDIQERVECRVNGTSRQQITASSPGNITEIIFSALRAQDYIVNISNVISDNGFCNAEIEDTNSPNRGRFMWEETVVGMTTRLDCPFGPSGEVGTRTCLSRRTWGASEITSCGTDVSLLFRALNSSLSQINITTDNVVTITSNLTTIVNNATDQADQNEENLQIVLVILTRVVELFDDLSTDVDFEVIEMVAINTVEIVDDIEEWPQDVIQSQANQIIHIIENVTQFLVIQPNFTNIIIQAEDIVIRAERETIEEFNGTTFVVQTQNNGNLNVGLETDLIQNQTSSISVPSSIIELLNDNNITLAFTIYRDASLFPIRRAPVGNVSNVIGSQVASMAIPGIPFGTTLPEPVNITLRLTNPITGTAENISNPVCVFWDFGAADGAGNWSTQGCRTIIVDSTSDLVRCECDHLTNFGCLVDISARTGTPPPSHLAVEIVTYIGVSLSLVGLILTIITYLIFKKLRTRDISKFHIQLSLALIFMLIVFVAGIDKTSHRGGCITTGVFIHYFTLVAIMWMGAEAVLMFQKLVIVFTNITWRYILAVSIICWVLPLLPVIISVAINPDFYITIYENSENPGFCFISNQGVFFGAFLVPIFLVLIFNFIIYIVVIRKLVKHILDRNKRKSNKYTMTTGEAVKLLLSSVGIMCLFGLTWLFAVFTFTSSNADVYFALQFLFAFFNAFQGFYIFLFFVVLSSDAREAWRGLLCKCLIKEESSKYEPHSSSTKTTNVKTSKPYSSYSSKISTFANSKSEEGDDHHDLMELDTKPNIDSNEKLPPYDIDEVKPVGSNYGEDPFDEKPKGFRLHRHSTTRRGHHVEKAEMDFYHDFDEDDNDEALF